MKVARNRGAKLRALAQNGLHSCFYEFMVGLRWSRFALAWFPQELLHVSEVGVDSRQAIEPMTSLEIPGAEGYVASINRFGVFRELGPCGPRFAIGLDSLFESGPMFRPFIKREKDCRPQFPSKKVSQAALNRHVCRQTPEFGTLRIRDSRFCCCQRGFRLHGMGFQCRCHPRRRIFCAGLASQQVAGKIIDAREKLGVERTDRDRKSVV